MTQPDQPTVTDAETFASRIITGCLYDTGLCACPGPPWRYDGCQAPNPQETTVAQPVDEPTLPPDLGAFLAALDAAADEPFNGLAQQPEAPANTVRSMPPGYLRGPDGIVRTETAHLAATADGPVDTPDAIARWLERQASPAHLFEVEPALTAAQQIRAGALKAAIDVIDLDIREWDINSVIPLAERFAAWVETGEQA